MRTFWNTISFLAVVNLLALILAVGWLGYSGRIDRTRVETVRDLFASPIGEAPVDDASPGGAVEVVGVEDGLGDDEGGLPVTHLGPITLSELRDDLEAETRISLERQAATLRANIEHHYAARRSELEARARAVRTLEARFEEIRVRSADAEFKQTVADLEEMKLDSAFGIVQAWLVQARDTPARRTFVVDILAALDSERRTKLLTEFVETGQANVAANLQLDLRDRASVTPPGPEFLDADDAPSQFSSSPVAVGGGVDR